MIAEATFVKLNMNLTSDKQRQFFEDRRRYIAYGGARGGGKSWAVRKKAVMLCLRYPGINVMVVRKTYPDLRDNHIKPMCKEFPYKRIARYNDQKKEFQFKNGSYILFRYCDNERDMEHYQGVEADIIFIDEATQHSEDVFRMFDACIRATNQYPKRLYLTCNPGGPGHGWMKRLFIDKAYKDSENPEEYAFIQALVQDNTALMHAQPRYIKQLEALPPKLRDAWLYGKWDVYEGQFFEDFTDNPAGYEGRIFTHVIPAFNPPASWKRFRSFDFGYAKPFSCGWWAMDPHGVLYRILEYYGCEPDRPNEGVKLEPTQIFAEIKRIEREHPYLKGMHVEGVADPSIWDRSRGPSIADVAAGQGVYFSPGDNKRLPGWMQVHHRLAFDEHGHPMMYVFNTCKAFIRTVPLLIYSKTRPEDLDTDQEDHCIDEVRYLCMRNPIPAPEYTPAPERAFDPLESNRKVHYLNM